MDSGGKDSGGQDPEESPEASSRVVLLGYGLAGRVFHAPLISAEPRLRIAAIVTSDPSRREQAARDLPGVPILASAAEAWDRAAEFDVAVVATANVTHVEYANAALESGLHVVVDKPLAGSAAQAEDLLSYARERNRQVHVFQNRRWDSEMLTIRRAIDEGLIGKPHRLESRFDRWRPIPKGGWRETGAPADLPGLLFDLGSHLIDQAIILLGPVERVAASLRIIRDGVSADDDTQLMLWHTSGGISLLGMSAVSAFIEPRMRLLGTRGGIEIIGLDGQEDALRAGGSPAHPDWGLERPEVDSVVVVTETGERLPLDRERGAWQTFYAEVSQCLSGSGAPPVDPRDAIANLRVIEAAMESHRSGDVVRLEPPASHVSR